MANVVGLYVGITPIQTRNLQIGLSEGMWGLKGSTFEYSDVGRLMLTVAPGDTLVVAHGGPPRSEKRWRDPRFRSVALCRVTTGHFEDHDPVWPVEADGEVYEHRVRFDVVRQTTGAVQLTSRELLDALALSQTKRGGLIPTTAGAADPLGDDVQVIGRSEPLSDVPDRLLDLAGATDAVSLARRRKEQARLRRLVVGTGPTATCSLCGRELPTRFVRAAHIKKRSLATEEERVHLANVMPACVLGCDELFEQRNIIVDASGTLVAGLPGATPALQGEIDSRLGRTCLSHNDQSEPYFAAHAGR